MKIHRLFLLSISKAKDVKVPPGISPFPKENPEPSSLRH
jgi:hypothetical protein